MFGSGVKEFLECFKNEGMLSKGRDQGGEKQVEREDQAASVSKQGKEGKIGSCVDSLFI